MKTKESDSAVYALDQGFSTIDYVSVPENPIAAPDNASETSLFNFNATHNGVECIESLDPKDKGTNWQFWFTIAMLCAIYEEVDSTIRRNIKSLNEEGEVDLQKCKSCVVTKDLAGTYHKTTIYNLEVLNKLGMCCFRGNKKAKEIRNKFNDVLVKHETQVWISEEDNLAIQIIHCNDTFECALLMKKRDELVHKTELKRSMTAIGKLGGISKARNVAIQERDEARQALEQKQQELEDVQTLYDEYKEHIGEGMKRMSSAQLLKNYPDKFNFAKCAATLTRFLKKSNVPNEQSDVPDSSGYPYAIFDVEEALKAAELRKLEEETKH